MKNKYPDVYIPEAPISHVILPKAAQYGKRVALIDVITGRTVTYHELRNDVLGVAASLAQRGVAKGDVVFICSPNCLEFPIVLLATVHLGAILTTCNPVYTVGEMLSQMRDSEPKLAFTAPGEFSVKVKEAAKQLGPGRIKEIVSLGECPGCTPYRDLLCGDARRLPHVVIEPKTEVALLPYSSGTTGKPKGVMLTHYNQVANIHLLGHPAAATETEKAGGHDVVMGLLPFFHSYGLGVVQLYSLFKGNTVVVLPRFDLQVYLSSIQKYKATFLYVVPPIVLLLAKDPMADRYDLSSVTSMVCAAAPMGHDMAVAVKQRLRITDVRQGYGLTETGPATHISPAFTDKYGSAGLALPNTEHKIVHTTSGRSLGAGEVGEVWIRGPQVMKGYFRNPSATAHTVDLDGWLHTGDLGYIDEDGYLFIVDRLKELIKYKGLQVAPAELESLVLTHPTVADVAVIGVPDESAGELPRAYVVLKSGMTATAQDITAFVKGNLAPHKQLRGGVRFVREIPKSSSGKILRRMLRDQARGELKAKL